MQTGFLNSLQADQRAAALAPAASVLPAGATPAPTAVPMSAGAPSSTMNAYRPPPIPPPVGGNDPGIQPYLDQIRSMWQSGGQARKVAPYLSSFYNANQGTQQMGSAQVARIAADPYNVPESIRTDMLLNQDQAYQTAANRARASAFGSGQISGGQAGGVAASNIGNVEMSRGAGMADAERAFAEFRTKLGDSRIEQIVLPWLQQMSNEWDAALGVARNDKTNIHKKRNWLKTVAGAAVAVVGGYFTGGALTPVGLGIMADAAPKDYTVNTWEQ